MDVKIRGKIFFQRAEIVLDMSVEFFTRRFAAFDCRGQCIELCVKATDPLAQHLGTGTIPNLVRRNFSIPSAFWTSLTVRKRVSRNLFSSITQSWIKESRASSGAVWPISIRIPSSLSVRLSCPSWKRCWRDWTEVNICCSNDARLSLSSFSASSFSFRATSRPCFLVSVS